MSDARKPRASADDGSRDLIGSKPPPFLLPIALLAILPFGGCYSYRTVRVTVLDAETGRPVPGAVVKTDYQTGLAHGAPATSRGVTGPAGTTTLRVAKDPLGIFIRPSADGYLDYWADGAFPDGKPCNRPHTELPAWPFEAVTLTLYAEPPPQVVVVVPEEYRGLIGIERGYGRRGNPQPGKRVFEIAWRPGDVVHLSEVPQMGGIPPVVTRVRYNSGQEIPVGRPRTEGTGWWRTGTGILVGDWEDRRALPAGQ